MKWQLCTIKTAKPPAVRGQRLCLRPPIQCRAPDTARWVVEPAEELDTRFDYGSIPLGVTEGRSAT